MNYKIREVHFSDIPDIYHICHLTGFSGTDCGDRLSDKYLIGQYYAAPYIFFEPDVCFVITEYDLPKGYILGTSNSVKFYNWMNDYWLPELRKKYSLDHMEEFSDFEKNLRKRIHQDIVLPEYLKNHPAHLHIDLLPEVQKKGFGKKLMDSFYAKLTAKDIHKLHLGVGNDNLNGIEFYKRIGMYEIKSEPGVIFMGIDF